MIHPSEEYSQWLSIPTEDQTLTRFSSEVHLREVDKLELQHLNDYDNR